MSEPRTAAELIEVAERVLTDSTRIDAEHDSLGEAEELLAFCLRITPDEIKDDVEPPRRVRERYLSLVARRAGGEPFPLLVGSTTFYGLEMRVRPGIFMPRPSSELMVERALRHLRRRKEPVIVDVCAGAGPIALALAYEVSEADVWALDISRGALNVGRENARNLGIENIRFLSGDMYEPLPRRLTGEVALITAHVPYIPAGELKDLPEEIKTYEPLHTLTDQSHDGMYLMRRAVQESVPWLMPGGWLLLETAEDIAPRVRRLIKDVGLEDHGVALDDDRLSAVVEARNPD